ncbi:MAG: dihydrofolate reductase [Akkermansiaceae bacterium]|jgi:dihydrofolate reductase
MLTAVVAMDPNRLIGRDGTLPWHLPEDLAFFKKTTLGHPVLMGRKTFESIGRPLPKRRNIVLTRDHDWKHDGVDIIHSPSEIPKTDEKIFIIGGAEIYRALTEQIDEWLVSHVHETYEGNTHLAPFEADFPNVEIVETHETFTVRRYWRAAPECGGSPPP